MKYWSHNAAYHPLIVDVARGLEGDVLDVGCGEGLLVERRASVSRFVTGVDADPQAVMRARARIETLLNATVYEGDFLEIFLEPGSFDLVTMVATLHHLDFEEAVSRMCSLLRPGGKLIVIGLSANRTIGDWVLSGAALPVVHPMGRIHGEHRDIRVVTRAPTQTLREIREGASRLLPGCKIKRGLYYRYILLWTKAR